LVGGSRFRLLPLVLRAHVRESLHNTRGERISPHHPVGYRRGIPHGGTSALTLDTLDKRLCTPPRDAQKATRRRRFAGVGVRAL
jgi:hypothetical protein